LKRDLLATPVTPACYNASGCYSLKRGDAVVGFERVTYEVTQQDRAGAQAIRPRLNRRFAGLPDAVLGIEMLYLYGRKPGGEV